MKELWTCPQCGARFVGRNMWHGCGDYTADGYLSDKTPLAREVYERLHKELMRIGDVVVHPVKTRIAFMGRTRFAGLTANKSRVTVNIGLPREVKSPRVKRVEHLLGWYVHHIPVTSADDIDDEMRSWLAESYREMGMQERLKGSR